MSSASTRRQFLKSAATVVAAAPLAALASAGASAEFPQIESALDSDFPTPKPAYGPPARTAAIDAWYWRIDSVIVTLERLWGAIGEARTLPPSEVDGAKINDLECTAIRAMEALISSIDHSDLDEDFYLGATGKRKYFWCLKSDIEAGQGSREFYQREIDAYRDDPAFAELQALLDARFPLEVL
jgi:hypothetical protein